MSEPSRLRARAALLLLALLIVIGLVQSFDIVFHLWGPDSDVADPVLLWQGFLRHGPEYLARWRYTQDNWLLSLIPFDFAVFSLLGDRPVVVIATGLAFFYLLALLTGVVVGRLRGGLAGGFAGMVLLFTAQPALGNEGFLGYAVSHGISLIWGLLGLLFATLWLDRRRMAFLVAAGVCLFVGCVSDPWDDAAFLVPLAVASGLLAWRAPAEARWPMVAILVMSVIVGLLVQSRGLGLLVFLPRPQHQIVSWPHMRQNMVIVARYVAVLFNVLPGSFWQASANPTLAAIGFDGGLFLAIIVYCTLRLLQRAAMVSQTRLLVALSALGSIGLMVVALVVTGFQSGMVTARYLSNIVVALPLLIAASPIGIGRFRMVEAGAALVVGALFVASGLISGRPLWRLGAPPLVMNGIPQLASALERQGVDFAYGPYWPTEANAMAWVTRGKVTIRPDNFDPVSGRFVPQGAQTMAAWYAPETEHRAPQPVAIIVRSAPGACGGRSCAAAATAQFGAPTRIIPDGALSLLIYHHMVTFAP